MAYLAWLPAQWATVVTSWAQGLLTQPEASRGAPDYSN